MDTPDEQRIDIRGVLHAQEQRRIQIARMAAPANWQAELEAELRADLHHPQSVFGGDDLRLFVYSFTACFVAVMTFLA